MSNKEWKKFDGDYEKQFYDVKTLDGEIHLGCWPNAGEIQRIDLVEGKHYDKTSFSEGECYIRISGSQFNW